MRRHFIVFPTIRTNLTSRIGASAAGLLLAGCGAVSSHSANLSSSASSQSKIANAIGSVAQVCGAGYSPGHVSIHRLTSVEYNNTVRDLLFDNTSPASSFPPPTIGKSGYTNDSDALV